MAIAENNNKSDISTKSILEISDSWSKSLNQLIDSIHNQNENIRKLKVINLCRTKVHTIRSLAFLPRSWRLSLELIMSITDKLQYSVNRTFEIHDICIWRVSLKNEG